MATALTRDPTRRTPTDHRGLLVTGCVLAAVLVAVAVLWATGALTDEVPSGLGDPGPLTRWGLPLATLVARLAAIATVGLLLAAAFFAPGLTGDEPSAERRSGTDGLTLGPLGYRWLQAGSRAAEVWVLATAAQVVFTLSDILGVPPSSAVGAVVHWGLQLEPTRAMVLTIFGAGAIALFARFVLSTTGAAWLAVIAVASVVPPAFTGHSNAAGNHQLAVDALLWHLVGSALWAGGLLALLLARRTASVVRAARRYSALAAWCYAIVALSGVTVALGQIDLPDLVSSDYGLAVLGKAVALVALGGFGLGQRRFALRGLEAGRPGAFRQLAIGELLLMAGTFGLAVALSRTAAPLVEAPEGSAQALLGYAPPAGPVTPRAVLLEWLPDPLFLGAAAIAVFFYVAGFLRLRRTGTAWPALRLVSWCAGWAVVVFATCSGLAAYAPLMFSVHMAQHLILMTLAPILLVLGAPVTLGLRALRRGDEPGMRGPRDWLQLALHSRITKVVAHPVVALGVMIVSLFGMYFTGLYGLALRSHLTHLAMLLHLLAVGYLFYWSVVGIDPTPHRVPPPARLLVLFAGMAFHAFFGVALMQAGVAMAADWYAALELSWLPDSLADQKAAGGIAWSFGEIPSLVVALALVAQWLRADEREARRFDRAAERAAASGRPELDPHEAYNAYLKQLAEADRQRDAR